MATANGDVHIETAESFARDYLDDLFNNNKNLGAFEEETLDLNITSKYDNIEVESVEEKNPEESTSVLQTASAESIPEPAATNAAILEDAPAESIGSSNSHNDNEEKNSVDEPLEPGQQTLQVNGNVSEVDVAERNGHHESEVIEPGHVEFSAQSTEPVITEQVSQLSIQKEALPEPGQNHLESAAETLITTEEKEDEEEAAESEDVVAPIPMSRGKAAKASDEDEEELDKIAEEMKFKKLGLSKNWWDSKRNESEVTKEPGKPVDKFRTIKQNIRKGNTRSLLERFENMSKVME